MAEPALLTIGLAFLMPLGYGLIACGGLSEDQARQAALSLLAALGLATLGYIFCGFAIQFGGIGLVYNQPGYEGLVWEWSALGPTWGAGWGMAGLAGWALAGPGANPSVYALALANLPWVVTATLIPLAALRGRIPALASALAGLLIGAFIYPLAGNWIWGGGWLANLGSNLGFGHGLVDVGGAGLIHALGAAAALAGIAVFLPRKPRPAASHEPVPLPPVHLPLLAVLGAGFLLAGGPAWIAVNPLLAGRNLDLFLVALNTTVVVAAAGLAPLAYTWFIAGRPDPLMAARGLAAGSIVGAALAPFVSPTTALLCGAAIGVLVPLVIFLLDRVLRVDDPTAALGVHGFAGALGLLAVGVFADGRAGADWNGVGAGSYLGVVRQGVSGLLAGVGYQVDFPGQLQAQIVGLAAVALFTFLVVWACLAPPAILVHLLQLQIARRTSRADRASGRPAAGGLAPQSDGAVDPPGATGVLRSLGPDDEVVDIVDDQELPGAGDLQTPTPAG
jgi:ammonium transporter, Amt family